MVCFVVHIRAREIDCSCNFQRRRIEICNLSGPRVFFVLLFTEILSMFIARYRDKYQGVLVISTHFVFSLWTNVQLESVSLVEFTISFEHIFVTLDGVRKVNDAQSMHQKSVIGTIRPPWTARVGGGVQKRTGKTFPTISNKNVVSPSPLPGSDRQRCEISREEG